MSPRLCTEKNEYAHLYGLLVLSSGLNRTDHCDSGTEGKTRYNRREETQRVCATDFDSPQCSCSCPCRCEVGRELLQQKMASEEKLELYVSILCNFSPERNREEREREVDLFWTSALTRVNLYATLNTCESNPLSYGFVRDPSVLSPLTE